MSHHLRHLPGHPQAVSSTAGVPSFVPKGFSPLGGIPVRGYDLAASLVFLLAFAGLLPIAVLRVVRPAPSHIALIRPFIALQARLVSMVIQAVQATGMRPSRLFLAEQFVLVSGFLVMSLIFLVAFTASLPIALLSIFRLKSRSMAALCPFIFVQARLATFIIRAVQATGHDSTGLFIAEQILLLSAFTLLCDNLVSLTYHHIARSLDATSLRARLLQYTSILLRLALLASIVLGIPAGAQVDGQLDWTVHTIKACRNANAGICLAVVIIVLVTICAAFFAVRELPARQTAYLFAISWLLTITSVYKSALYSLRTPDDRTTKITFYVVAALPELLVVSLYLLLNIKEEFGIEEDPSKGSKGAGRSPDFVGIPRLHPPEFGVVLDIAETPTTASFSDCGSSACSYYSFDGKDEKD